MRGQMYLLSAVLIVIFLATVFTYLNLNSNYDISYKYTKTYNVNWVTNATSRLVYTVTAKTNSHILILNFPYSFSNLTVFSSGPIAWQKDGDKIYLEDNIYASQEKVYYFYLNGTSYTFEPIYHDNDIYYFLTYSLDLPNATTYGGDSISFGCNTIESSGPVFTKFCNNYAFDDFIIAKNNFNLTANNLTVGGNVYTCDGVERSFSNELLIFQGNYFMELSNFTGTTNCSNGVWQISLNSPTRIYILLHADKYLSIGEYTYNVSFESIDDYFSSILPNYFGFYKCNKNGGLTNSFGDLNISAPWVNNSFISWNTTDLIYDGLNLQSGSILINDKSPTWEYYNSYIVGNVTDCNVSFNFFNMSPVIYVVPSGLCKLHLPIGSGSVSYTPGKLTIVNDNYKVVYLGHILSNSSFPDIYVDGDFYIIIARTNYMKPTFYNFTSLCPETS